MEPLYTRYIQETFGPDGQVTDWHYHYEDNFNYAYDIIDTMAAAEPWRLAMLWRNDRGAELKLTLEDLSVMSNRMANLFRSHGLKRGDVILTALRSHWSWWIVALAAHKLGLILAPCSYLLSEQDFLYRMTKAKAKCVVTCRENGADRRVLAAAEQAGVSVRFALGGGSGYLDLLGNMGPRTHPHLRQRPDPAVFHLRHHRPAQGRPARRRLHPEQLLGGQVYAGYPPRLPPLCHRRHRLGGGLRHQVLRPVDAGRGAAGV